jgi:hypothetical protein
MHVTQFDCCLEAAFFGLVRLSRQLLLTFIAGTQQHTALLPDDEASRNLLEYYSSTTPVLLQP